MVMEPKTIAELVTLARQGSVDARDELVRRHYREIAALAAAMVNDATEAEDLAQEAFIRAFRNLDLLVDPGRFGPWLRRIVIGVTIDWLRAFRPALYRGWSDADDVAISSPEPSPLDRVLSTEIVKRVRAALDALPPRYRVPISLFHLDGLSHAKIAATLDVPVTTVRSLVARARKKLLPLLGEFGPGMTPSIDEVFEEQPMTSAAQSRFLHVANGLSTTMTIEAAGIPGVCSIWADPLHDGPVPGGLTDAELLEVRATHLAGHLDGLNREAVNDLRQWRAAMERHESYDELILWYEHDLFDQLNLIQLLTWIRGHLPPAKPVTLICIGSFPGRPDFHGLGELTPDELASLLETRQRVSESQYALAERAWQAFRQPTPEALDDLRRSDTSALPYLAAAVTRFLEEYPWTGDGLSRAERRLLELADGDAIPLSKAFRRMHQGEASYYVSDESLASMADDLSPAANGQVLRGAVALTDAGRSVLAGRVDKVATYGIDRWFGGVHLQSGAPLWRWDASRQRIVRV
jgi:RNA polymerase sigma factor (sigma-70 family)